MPREADYHRGYRRAMDAAETAYERANAKAERERYATCQQAYKEERAIARTARAAGKLPYTDIDLATIDVAILKAREIYEQALARNKAHLAAAYAAADAAYETARAAALEAKRIVDINEAAAQEGVLTPPRKRCGYHRRKPQSRTSN
jgi:hypothetical protein